MEDVAREIAQILVDAGYSTPHPTSEAVPLLVALVARRTTEEREIIAALENRISTYAEHEVVLTNRINREVTEKLEARARIAELEKRIAELECPECGGAGGFDEAEGWHWCGTCTAGKERRHDPRR